MRCFTVTVGHLFTRTNNHTRTSSLSLVVSLNTAPLLRCAANSLTLRATRIGLFVRAHPRAAIFHHLHRGSLATRIIVVVSLGPATLCPSCSNCVRHSPHKSQHKSLSQFLAFRSDNHTCDPFDLTLPISSSRVPSHHQKTRTAPKPNCGGALLVYVPICVRALPLRPRCCRPNRSMWKREDVVVGQCTFTQSSVLHSVTGSESGSRRRYTTYSTH